MSKRKCTADAKTLLTLPTGTLRTDSVQLDFGFGIDGVGNVEHGNLS